jgi:hypothetical protein
MTPGIDRFDIALTTQLVRGRIECVGLDYQVRRTWPDRGTNDDGIIVVKTKSLAIRIAEPDKLQGDVKRPR